MLLQYLFLVAKNQQVNKITLAAVQDSCGFWANNGFDVLTDISVGSSYGDGAVLTEISIPT